MTFTLAALRDKPVGFFQMDDASPLQDYSGYSRTATISGGTPSQHASLVKGAAWAPVFTSVITAAYENPVFRQGFEHVPFTLAAWGHAVNPSGNSEQQILGNSGQLDGLTINGNVISFVTKYTAAPEARCTYDLQQERAWAVWGVHTETKNSLYVNGVLVSEVALTDIQQTATYVATSANLISGTTSGAQKVALNGVAYYASALSGPAIYAQFLAGRDVPRPEDAVLAQKGNFIPLSLSNGNLFLDHWWSTAEQWSSGVLDNINIVQDRLVPQVNVDTSQQGFWYSNVNIESTGLTSIYAVQFNWDGEGAVVEVSLDGTTWETVTRGKNVTTITPGMNPTNQVLQIRVSFPGGIVNDTSFIDNLNAVGMTTAVTNNVAGRTLTYSNATPGRDYQPLEYHDNWGAKINSGGTVVISADTLESSVARTIELLIKRNGTNPTLSMTGTTYQNGVVATATLVDDQWTLMHVVAAADVTGSITINGPAQVGYVGIYPTAWTAAQVAASYAQLMGTDAISARDVSVVNVLEALNSATIYAHDWSILASG